jgi:hypothetical protein
MPAAKIYTKEDILRSMKYSRSVKAAARYLGCSYIHVKAYFKMFKVDEMDPNSPTLFDIHLNRSAKGIPKKLKNNKKEPIVKQIFLEGTGYEPFTTDKIKSRGLAEGYLKDECYMCGFNERRMTDFKVPLLMSFKDGNKLNYLLGNLELLCYNCYFLYVANPLNNSDIRNIEENSDRVLAKPFEWDLDAEQLANIKSLGLNI